MDVIFAPDWRQGVPYQRLLADALTAQGVNVSFLEGYKRLFPLRRLLASKRCDVLHLHWPEAYYPRKGDAWDWFRRARFAFDLRGALRRGALATTAHNLHAHNRRAESFAHRNTRATHTLARVVFAHSPVAKQKLIEAFQLPAEKVVVVPHGDLSVTLGTPVPQDEARSSLGISSEKLALVFGAVEPYKGQEEIIRWWKEHQPAVTLAIVGKPESPEYAAHLTALIADAPNILTRFGWLSDEQLRLWLSAANATIFNYREIFTSGAANLARSWGLPMLLPTRLDTVTLDEPTPTVRRFADVQEFGERLREILTVPADFAAASSWREACKWETVARLTAEAYRARCQ
jgi:glycosyltransferase involved in cell wall biosynthesis